MKKQNIRRMLAMFLVLTMVMSFAMPVAAMETSDNTVVAMETSDNTIAGVEKVDNSEVSSKFSMQEVEESEEEPPYADDDIVRVAIVMDGKSTMDAGYEISDISSNVKAMSYRAKLESKQLDIEDKISTQALNGKKLDVAWNLTLAVNLISANVEFGKIEQIKNVEGVSDVYIETVYSMNDELNSNDVSINMTSSSQMIGSDQVWDSGYTGAGSRIAVIDTGLDLDHPLFSGEAFEYALSDNAEEEKMTDADYIASLNLLDEEELEELMPKLNAAKNSTDLTVDALYRNAKVAYGFNYKDVSLDITHDNDTQGDHGTHVSGIATANRYIADDGSFVSSMDAVNVCGVAPDAQLVVMKVFGTNGATTDSDYMAAIEDAILLGCDSINLSLGTSSAGYMRSFVDYYGQIFEKLEESNSVVSISAGNSSYWSNSAKTVLPHLYGDDINFDTVGDPGSKENALTVASADNIGITSESFIVDGEEYTFNESKKFNNRLLASLDTSEKQTGSEYDFVFLDTYGFAEDYTSIDVKGKIVILSRGNMSYVEKHQYAEAAGALGLIVYNSEDGMMYMDLSTSTATIPCVFISKNSGDAIREFAEKQNDGTYTGKITFNAKPSIHYGDGSVAMSEFSSWGVPGALILKPEITAPGGNIYSTLDEGTYGSMSGTSMASPQIAGMAALVAQYCRENEIEEDINVRELTTSLLMSTASPLKDEEGNLYSVLSQGAGLANINDALASPTYIKMNDRDDGKVKVELGDDSNRTGEYKFSFTVNNFSQQSHAYVLDASTMTQGLLSGYANDTKSDDQICSYLDTATVDLDSVVTFTADGKAFDNDSFADYDFNGDNQVNKTDAQMLLDYTVNSEVVLNNLEYADISNDGTVTAYDAYLMLKMLNKEIIQVPAGSEITVEATIILPKDVKNMLDENYENGAYIEGFVYLHNVADEEGNILSSHSIPVLGFYGNWTDASMYDVLTRSEYQYKTDIRSSYLPTYGNTNFLSISYEGDTAEYYLEGNPLLTDSTYLPERNAINSDRRDKLTSLTYSNIRNAIDSKIIITDAESGELYMEKEYGTVDAAYFSDRAYSWQATTKKINVNWCGTDADGAILPEGTKVNVSLVLAPEYYLNEDGTCRWEDLGEGAYMTTPVTIDNTSPEITSVLVNKVDGTLDVTAQDNQYIAAIALFDNSGTKMIAGSTPNQMVAGEEEKIALSLDTLPGSKFLVQVVDYAMNITTYRIDKDQLGDIVKDQTFKYNTYDLITKSWIGFDDDSDAISTVAYSPISYYAGTYADGYVFLSDTKGNLYVTEPDALDDTTYVTNLGVVVVDMAYNSVDKMLYAITNNGNLISIDKLTGAVKDYGHVETRSGTTTLACDEDGNFYSLDDWSMGNGSPSLLYKYTLDTIDVPTEIGETKSKSTDINYGVKFTQSIEWNPDDDCIYWTSLDDYYMRSFFGFAKIDPATADITKVNDLVMWGTSLFFAPENVEKQAWAEPTDVIGSMYISDDTVDLIVNHDVALSATVLPWTLTDRSVIWSSSDSEVASVDNNGTVTGLKKGTAVITATSNLHPESSVSCTVTVDSLHNTVRGVLQTADGKTNIFSWDFTNDETWSRVADVDSTVCSAAYDNKNNAIYLYDANDGNWSIHQVNVDNGEIENTATALTVPMTDMTYSEYFSTEEAPKIAGIYGTLMFTPKDPMNMDDVGFVFDKLLKQTSASKMIAIASAGHKLFHDDEKQKDVDTELYYLLDNAGYMWTVYICSSEDGKYDAYVNYYYTGLNNLSFPMYGSYNQYCSLVVDKGSECLFFSHFTGTTNEIYLLKFDGERFYPTLMGNMGEEVWPAALYDVTYDGEQSEPIVTTNSAIYVESQHLNISQPITEDVTTSSAINAELQNGGLNSVESYQVQSSENRTISYDPVAQTVTVTVRASENTVSTMMNFKYDKNILTLTGISSPAEISAHKVTENGVSFACASSNDIMDGNPLVTLTFKYSSENEGSSSDLLLTTTERNEDKLDMVDSYKIVIPGGGSGTLPNPDKPVTVPDKPETDTDTTTENSFNDIDKAEWYNEYVDYVTEKGLMKGISDTVFAPNVSLTRAMLVMILSRIEDDIDITEKNAFADVADGQWYTDVVSWATENGIVNGYSDGSFRPNAPITRQQLALILWRYAQYKGIDVSSDGTVMPEFKDISMIEPWAREAMSWACTNGIISGKDNNRLDPAGNATRAEVAAMVVRFLKMSSVQEKIKF